MMAQLSFVSPVSLPQVSHMPANENGAASRLDIKYGCLRLPSVFHSKNPEAGIRQRRWRKDRLNAGFSTTLCPGIINTGSFFIS